MRTGCLAAVGLQRDRAGATDDPGCAPGGTEPLEARGQPEPVECVADDVKRGKRTSFPRSVKLRKGETVVFSYIVYKSRAQRDRVNGKVMKDKRIAPMMNLKALPFDAKRMFWGGFGVLVDA